MNTGVGDAIDLSWKLAASLAGWGGPLLLKSYELERRPIGFRNVKASRAAMTGRIGWRAAYEPNIGDNTWEGAATRARIATLFDLEQRKVTEISGIEAGYRYTDSPIIRPESGDGPDPDSPVYSPTTWPGARLPHVWLDDGTALHDHLGSGFTLLRLGATSVDTTGLERAFRAICAPLEILDIASARAREIYLYDLLLIRPDLHVVWRGNQVPGDGNELAQVATGQLLRPP
jgi:hypothetical protein